MTSNENGDGGTSADVALASGVRAVAVAGDVAAVVEGAASAFGRMFGTRAECAVYLGSEGDGIGLAAASDGAEPPSGDSVADALAAGESARVGRHVDGDEHDGWSLLIPVAGDGVVVVQVGDRPATPPRRDLRTLATTTHRRVGDLATVASLTDEVESLQADNEQLTEFASIVAHDLRNPLAVARGRLELAIETGDEEHFEHIETAHERIESIIDHTLTLAKDGNAENPQAVDLATMVEMAWSTVDTDAVTLDVAETTRLTADDERLRQLLENLFRNAVEHSANETGDGADGDTDVGVRVGTIERDDAVVGFYLEDDGPGIPEDERESVFEHGYTTIADGTGYGLAIVEDIVDDHGWSIAVTDGTGGGARFEITGID